METTALSALLAALLSLGVPSEDSYELPAIAGLWQLDVPRQGGVCPERYNFGKDGRFSTQSSEEYTKGEYQFAYVSDLPLPALAIKTQYDNKAPDCSDNQIDQTGEIFAGFVKLDGKHNPTTMQWCSDPLGQDCGVVLKRVLP